MTTNVDDWFAQFEEKGLTPQVEETTDFFDQFSEEGEEEQPLPPTGEVVSEPTNEIGERLSEIKVAFGPWESEDTTWAELIGEDGTAALVGAGAGVMDSYRGLKQIFGIDAEQEAANEVILNELLADEEYGAEALGGLIGGAIVDPVGLAIGGGAAGAVAKAAKVGKILSTAKKPLSTAVQGAIVGSAQTGTGYVDEEGVFNRAGLMAVGGALGGGLGMLAGRSAQNAANNAERGAFDKIRELERAVGGLTRHGEMNPNDALRLVREQDPDLVSDALEASKQVGARPDLINAGKNYELAVEADRGIMPVEALAVQGSKSRGNFVRAVDKLAGVLSSQVKRINPRVFGKLRQYDAAISFRPEKYRKMREGFANMFASRTGRRITEAGLRQLDAEDVTTLNYHLLNGNFKEARKFLRARGGEDAVKRFDESLKVYDELGKDLEDIGALDKRLPNYWHRSIDLEKRDEFMEVLKKDVGPDVQKKWEKHKDTINSRLIEQRGYNMNAYEEATAFERFIFGATPETYNVSSLMNRKLKNIKKDWVKYYANPIESMDSYIHSAVAEIEKAKFFGKEIYKSGMRAPGQFNLTKTLDNWQASDMLKGLEVEDQRELIDLINLRFGRGMSSAGELVSNYKALVNATLLGNPISAITQLGDLGVSMYKNGVLRTSRTVLNNIMDQATPGTKRITIEDLGLEQRFTEFEDLANAARLSKTAKKAKAAQDWLFQKSGFTTVDRVGKEAMVNSALDKAIKTVKNPNSGAYKSWSKEMQRTVGTADFLQLQKDLKAYDKAGRTKEMLTDDILSYAFSKLADIQPISKSEVPQYYLSSPVGKTLFTLKTFMIKQLDILRNDVIVNMRSNPIEAGKSLIAYTTLLGSMNLGADKLKAIASGKESIHDMDDGEQALAVGNLMKSIYGSTLKTFGFTGYTMREAAKDGATGLAFNYIVPPLPIADEMVKAGMRAYGGGEAFTESMERRLFSQIPLVGRVMAERVLPQEEAGAISGGEMSTEGFAEGGEVEAKEKKEEEVPKMEKLEPGIYQDEAGHFFRVGEKGEIEEMMFGEDDGKET